MDLGSRNGTKINGNPIKEVAANAGDIMEIGPVKLVFQIDGEPEQIGQAAPVVIEDASDDGGGLELMEKSPDSQGLGSIGETDDLDMLGAEPGSFGDDDLDSLLEDFGAGGNDVDAFDSDDSKISEGSFLDDMEL